MGNFFGYCRISTKESRDLQRFTRQEKALARFAAENGIDFTLILRDDCSGKSFDRPNWKKLEKLLHPGDTIVFQDLSRFSRDCEAGLQKYLDFMNRGINLVFLDNPSVCTDYIQQLSAAAEQQKNRVARVALENTVHLLLIVELDRTEQERLEISKRIRQGIHASDKPSGRPKGKLDKMSPALEADIKKFLQDRTMKQVDLMQKYGISRNTLKKYIAVVAQQK